MGGAETSLRELLANVRSREPGWDLRLIVGSDGPLVEIARQLGLQVTVAALPPLLARLGDGGRRAAAFGQQLGAIAATVRYVRELAALLRAIQPDIVHTNGLKMHVLGACALPRGAALVWHIHDYVSARPMMRRLLRLFTGRCATAVANSASVCSDLRSLYPQLKVTAVYNAVDLKRFAPAGRQLDLDGLCGLPAAAAGTVRIGLVATFAHWKGHKIFLEALSRLGSAAPVRGYIIGGPIYQTSGSQWQMQELQEEARKLGVSERVGFTGFLEDTPAAMRSLHIAVHASTRPEPFGMAIIEAMACGKPVIVSRAGGALELFQDEGTALGHTPGDAADLARQIARLVENPDLRVRLGEAARAAVALNFPGQRLAAELTAVYRDCLTAAGKPVAFVPSLNS